MPKPRKETIEWKAGEYYHLYNRGARRKTIFSEVDNYIFVIRRLKKNCAKYNLTLIAYCLIPNHYHLLVRQNAAFIAGFLAQYTFLSYTKAFNKRYQERGTLFEGRYGAKHVDSEAYLLYLCQYIHFNPVKDGIVASLDAWPYSNYLEWVGEREGTLVDHDFVREKFGGADAYRRQIQEFRVNSRYSTGSTGL